MGIEPTWDFVEPHTGLANQRPGDPTALHSKTLQQEAPMVAAPCAAPAPESPALADLARQLAGLSPEDRRALTKMLGGE